MPEQYHGYESHRVIFFIHAVSDEVSSVILIHACMSHDAKHLADATAISWV